MQLQLTQTITMKKKLPLSICLLVVFITITVTHKCYGQHAIPQVEYKLVWQDDFKGTEIDTTHWSIIKRGPSAWQKYMSSNKTLFRMRKGYLRLYARRNKNLEPNDTAPYLTGGIFSRDKTTFGFGKIEIRARINGATGCWPAIWISANDPTAWASKRRAEIDVMEYVNHDDHVTQTLHTYFTDELKKSKSPQSQVFPKVDVKRWNTYGVEILPDRVKLTVNGECQLEYPRIKTDDEGQFPFGVESFLLIDMQVGNKYLKNIIESEYPAWMDVDWVRVYEVAE